MHVHRVGIVAHKTIVRIDGGAIRVHTHSTVFIVDRTNRLATAMNIFYFDRTLNFV